MIKKLLFIIFILIFGVIYVSADDSIVTRIFSEFTEYPCTELNVTLEVDINEAESYYTIDELIPPGAIILDPGNGDVSQNRHIKWVQVSGADDTIFEYSLVIPCDTIGNHIFEGTYMFEGDPIKNNILGERVIKVYGPSDFDRYLSNRWNLISLPLLIEDYSIPGEFAGLGDDYEIFAYDALTRKWKYYSPSAPFYLNTLNQINNTMGLWIRPQFSTVFSIQGREFDSMDFKLSEGWNLIGYPFTDTKPIEDVLHDIEGSYTSVFMYDGYDWQLHDSTKPDFLNTLTSFIPGYGYWILATDDVTLRMEV